ERLAMAWLPTSGWPTMAKAPCKEAANYSQGQPARGDARPRPDRRSSSLRVSGYSSALARGGSRPRPGRRGCYQCPARP
ncbi:hypothetical protein B296_00038782, partial [Ensete ventricosum]